jgi:CRP-like cAMP-binding protein
MIPSNPPIRNQLLTALANTEYQHLLPHLHRVEMPLGKVVYSAGRNIIHVYFPETCVVSLLSVLESGNTTEVGLVGREGMVGLTVFLGGAITPERALVQLGGTALRMDASVLRNELRTGSRLQILLLNYTRAFIALMSQSVACSQHHQLEQRLSRWLLMMHDYSESDTLKLTHEMVANMIGTRRAGVTVALLALRQLGLISASRGQVTIRNREGLESSACECYGIIREEYRRLYEKTPAQNVIRD